MRAVSGAAHRLVRSTRLGAVSGGHIAVFHGPYLAHHVHRRVSFERQPLAQITPPELDQSELRGSSELAQLSCELRGSSEGAQSSSGQVRVDATVEERRIERRALQFVHVLVVPYLVEPRRFRQTDLGLEHLLTHLERANGPARPVAVVLLGQRKGCSSVLISAHQCSSMLISAHQRSSVLISAHQCSSVLISRNPWPAGRNALDCMHTWSVRYTS